MSRSRYRIEYKGAFYHVTQRGNNREKILKKDTEKVLLLQKLEEFAEMLDFSLFGYVVMDNHYHLLLQANEDPLSKIMHRLNNYYSRSYNTAYNRSGHVFGGRYKASLIQDESYLFAVLRYIHWNPVKAGICSSPADYSWSSDRLYRKNNRGWVNIDFLLNILHSDRKRALKEYIKLMQINDEGDYEKDSIIGDKAFISSIKQKKEQVQRKELDEILWETGISDIDFKLIKKGSRKRHLAFYKTAYVQEALKHQYTYKEIGENIGISDAAVYKLVNKVG